jgi:hypothetical protein
MDLYSIQSVIAERSQETPNCHRAQFQSIGHGGGRLEGQFIQVLREILGNTSLGRCANLYIFPKFLAKVFQILRLADGLSDVWSHQLLEQSGAQISQSRRSCFGCCS